MAKRSYKITIKAHSNRKRKMGDVELQLYLREINRGTGVHGLVSRKQERRNKKQKIRRGDYEE